MDAVDGVWRWRQNATGGGGGGGERGGAGCETRSLRRPPPGGGKPFNSPSSSSELEDLGSSWPRSWIDKACSPTGFPRAPGRAACPPPTRARARPPFRASVNCRLSCQALHVLNLGSWNDSPSSLDLLVFFFFGSRSGWVVQNLLLGERQRKRRGYAAGERPALSGP